MVAFRLALPAIWPEIRRPYISRISSAGRLSRILRRREKLSHFLAHFPRCWQNTALACRSIGIGSPHITQVRPLIPIIIWIAAALWCRCLWVWAFGRFSRRPWRAGGWATKISPASSISPFGSGRAIVRIMPQTAAQGDPAFCEGLVYCHPTGHGRGCYGASGDKPVQLTTILRQAALHLYQRLTGLRYTL
jgi:hypothetical protein